MSVPIFFYAAVSVSPEQIIPHFVLDFGLPKVGLSVMAFSFLLSSRIVLASVFLIVDQATHPFQLISWLLI